MRKVKLAVFRFLFLVLLASRVYPLWTRIHRTLFDRAARKTPLPVFKNIEEILPFLRGFVWRADSWIDLGDAMCTPEMVWYRYLNNVDHKIGDCDEFACFLSNVIQKSIEENVWKSIIEDPDIMTVMWLDPDGRPQGHNVCLLRLGPCYGYMDYDTPKWCGGKVQVVQAVLKNYGRGSNLIGWAVHSPKLKLREFHSP